MLNKRDRYKAADKQLFTRKTLLKSNIYRVVRKVLFGFIAVSIINFTYSYFFYTPKVYSLTEENNKLFLKLLILQDKLNFSKNNLAEIENRNNNIYKVILGVDTASLVEPLAMYGDKELYTGKRYGDLIGNAWSDINSISQRLFMQSISFDTLQYLSANRGEMLESIPAIWPVNRDDLRRISCYYGNRKHPIFGHWHFHTGIDLAAPKGTPIYSTASGVVKLSGWSAGYGNNVTIDHGYGYKTRYAHANKLLVEKGDTVARGELIAEVGNTGNSTGDHLHYEILYRNRNINPIVYFGKDMTSEDFYKIINEANKVEEQDENQ